jgi:hypothetical protein
MESAITIRASGAQKASRRPRFLAAGSASSCSCGGAGEAGEVGPPGGVVDRGRHAVEPVEPPLDPRRAGAAGHPGDDEFGLDPAAGRDIRHGLPLMFMPPVPLPVFTVVPEPPVAGPGEGTRQWG